MLGTSCTSFFKPTTTLQVGDTSHDLGDQSLNNMSKVSHPARWHTFLFKAHVLFYLMKLVVVVEREAPESRKPSSFRWSEQLGQTPSSGNWSPAGASLRGASADLLSLPAALSRPHNSLG